MAGGTTKFGLAMRNFTAFPELPDTDALLDYAVRAEELAGKPSGESTATVRARVERCRARQRERNGERDGTTTNAEVGLDVLERVAELGQEEVAHLAHATRVLGLTARSWHRVIRVARTIADLAERDRIERTDLSEALTYRVLDQRSRQTDGLRIQSRGAGR